MVEAALFGALLGFGVIVFLRGMNPSDATLQQRIESLSLPPEEDLFVEINPTNFDELRQQVAVRLLQMTSAEKMPEIQADVAAARTDIERFAVDKLYAAVGLGAGLVLLGWRLGFVSTLIGGILIAITGAYIGYRLPDIETSKKAVEGREEFEVALNSFVSLVAVSMSGGGGLNTAMVDAASVGRGWVFEMLQDVLADAQVRNEPAYRALDRLGRRLQVDGLIELAGALSLAADSGAQMFQTLLARAESGRAKMLADARTQAEGRTASLGVPLGALIIGWVGFLGYPAMANLLTGLG